MVNFKNILDRSKELVKRVGVKTWIAACAVLLLGSVVVVNYILTSGADDDGGKKLAVDLSADGDEINDGDEQQVSSGSGDYFAAVSLQRKQARDEAMEVLLSVSENETALEEARQAALNDMSAMALDIERESNIETLIRARGFEQCVAVISDDNCSVIVDSDGLLPGQIAQIAEIVYEQAGIIPENLNIIEK